MIAGWAPSLASLLPAQSLKKTADGALSPEVAQQIKLIAVDLAIVRRSMGQLAANQDQFAAKQEQMNQSIATLQQAEQDARQQVLAAATSPALADALR
jgi:transcription elongation GreA/GreB family factor